LLLSSLPLNKLASKSGGLYSKGNFTFLLWQHIENSTSFNLLDLSDVVSYHTSA